MNVRLLVWAGALTSVTCASLATTFIAANFAPGVGWTTLTLLVPLTVGLPTTLGLLGWVTVWDGSMSWLFGLLAIATGFVLQWASIRCVAHRWRRRA